MRNFLLTLITLGIFLLPFDSIPNVFPSTYRPIALYFFVLSGIIIIFIEKFDKTSLFLLIFSIFGTLSTLILNYINSFDSLFPIDFFITSLSSFFVYISLNYYFKKKLSNNLAFFLERAFNVVKSSFRLIVLFGIIQLFQQFIDLNQLRFIQDIVIFFTGKSSSRIHLFTLEASWASYSLIFIIPIFYLSKKKYDRIFLFLSIILFIFIFSLAGFIIVFLSLLIYSIIFLKIKNLMTLIITIITISLIYILMINSNFFSEDGYYISRFVKILNIKSIRDLLFIDGSIFIRIGYPLIAFEIFIENLFFGVGMDNFSLYFGTYILEKFPEAINFVQVSNNLNFKIGSTMNLYLRLLSEGGIINTFLYILFIYPTFKFLYLVKKNKLKQTQIISLWVILVLIIMTQFDSFIYLYFIFMVAMINNINKIIYPKER